MPGHIYIAPFERITIPGGAPEDTFWTSQKADRMVGNFDLGSILQKGSTNPTDIRPGIHVYDSQQVLDRALYLGNDPRARMTTTQKEVAQTALGVTFDANTFVGMMEEIMTMPGKYDPVGDTRWAPLRTSRQTGMRFYLGGFGLLFRSQFNHSQPVFAATLDVRRVNYERERDRAETLPDRERDAIILGLQMQTDYDAVNLFGRSARDDDDEILDVLLPNKYRVDGSKPRGTTKGDTFVEGSDTNLSSHTATGPNGGFSWSYTLGSDAIVIAATDRVVSQVATNRLRGEGVVSGDDQLCDMAVIVQGGNQSAIGARFAAAVDTAIAFFVRNEETTTYRLFQIVTGSLTQIGSSINATPPVVPYKMTIAVTAADAITGLVDGSLVIGPSSNTAGQGNVRGGMNLIVGLEVDNYQIQDQPVGDDLQSERFFLGGLVPGEKAVTTAGIAEALTASNRVRSVTIVAKAGNSGQAYVGGPDIASTTNDGLDARESITIKPGKFFDLADLFIDVDSDGEGVDFFASKN